MRADSRRPKQPVTWIPQVLELFKLRGHVTSRELAATVGKTMGGDAITRCQQLGIPLQSIGIVNGSRPPRKLYSIDAPFLWLALEEARQQINRYALLLNMQTQSADFLTFPSMATWIQHVRRIQKARPNPRRRRKTL